MMFHRLKPSRSMPDWQRRSSPTVKEPDLHPALSGDEVYTPSSRRSEGWRGQLFGRCSNRTTSKTSILTLNEQRNCSSLIRLDVFENKLFKITYFFLQKAM